MRLFPCLLLALTSVALAQTATPPAGPIPTVTLQWQPITTMSDGTAIPTGATVSYNLYGGHSATALTLIAAPVYQCASICSATRTNVTLGIDCYTVTAVINGVESLQATPGCVNVVQGAASTVPLTPVNFTVAQTS